MRHLLDLYDSGLLRRALLEAVLAGALCGAVGAHVVLRRLPFFTITVAHATFPGIVLASIIGLSELVGGLAFAVLLVVAIYVTTGNRDLDTNVAVGVALAGSFGMGVMLQSTQDGFTKDLAAILVGSVITVERSDVVTTVVVGAAVLALLAAAHKELVFRAFDPQGAAAQGYPRLLDLGLLLAVGATVVATVPAVGTILSVALLSVPALTARLVTERVGTAMSVGAAYGAASGVIGLTASAEWDYAAGASITLASALLFLATFAVVTTARRGSRRRALRAAATA
jgi:ABC-type Mn2+/Zn2+ transport system permease subunit